MSAIRVVMADDSPLAREVLRDILTRDGDIEIVGEATNGQEAVEMARRLSPQLITMDLTMPIMDGLSAIEEIMHTKGVPIVVISDRSDAQTAYRALEVGALEVLPKPGLDDEDAQRLLARVRLPVSVAQSSERLLPGHIYLCPPDSQINVTAQHRLQLSPGPAQALYHPSCDAMLHSVASVYGADSIGVILTGMGRDGVSGMRAIQLAGGTTLAQDEASSVIYGMNQEAINAGVVQQVLGLDEIPTRLLRDVRFTPSPWRAPQ